LLFLPMISHASVHRFTGFQNVVAALILPLKSGPLKTRGTAEGVRFGRTAQFDHEINFLEPHRSFGQ
jgi:hypothetical protein